MLDGTMAYCPNCAAPLAANAADCPKCRAIFPAGSAWAPVDTAPKIDAVDVGGTVIIRLVILFAGCVLAVPLTFAAVFATFSSVRAANTIYLVVALLIFGAIWAVSPIFGSSGGERKPKGARD